MKQVPKEYPRGIAGKAVMRRLCAAERLPRAKRGLSLALAALTAATPILALLFLLLGWTGAGLIALLIACAAFFCAALLSLLSVAIFSLLYADLRTANGRYALMTDYMRGRLFGVLATYRTQLLQKEEGEALLSDVERYARNFVLAFGDFDALSAAHGDIDEEALKILAPYLGLLEYLLKASDGECHRYLTVRQAAGRTVKRWCLRILPRYAPLQHPLLARNASFILQALAERYPANAEQGQAQLLHSLMREAVFYRDPERGGEKLLIPGCFRYRAFSELVRRISAFPVQELSAGGGGERIAAYSALLDEYDAYARRYTLYGSKALDTEQGRRHCEQAIKDASACYKCGLNYNGRHRAVCSRCGHYICPDCGGCYCEKLITHDMAHAAFRCE